MSNRRYSMYKKAAVEITRFLLTSLQDTESTRNREIVDAYLLFLALQLPYQA
jgi:hypothetical protein